MNTARSAPRRVVTGVREGKSVFLSDGEMPNCHHYLGWPGFMTSVAWTTAAVPTIEPGDLAEAARPGCEVLPGPGETRLMFVRFPPDSVFADPRFDAAVLDKEQAFHLNSLSRCFESEDPGMHRTASLDYDIVLENEIWLELDDGETRHLAQGDVAIQRGTRHAWRNKSDKPTTMCFVLIGAQT
ncbi:cupin domain-containing protein [Novosphingobium profundi]|uniref:cupin domain-containing protein n=1 Tax=Novosphingobium profundi TaxID=1774954 RepID=UPI001BD9B5E0|nr:cupin domain-containing protein [Novosphingobium profundi]MBT0669172.1 cupin domain-containing protein [Novosphingobium profundi]